MRSIEQIVSSLSGGNQQKVALAKWLDFNPEVIIFDEPTRGIDIGAKTEIYSIMGELAAQGAAIVMVSSELPELISVADRIMVMQEGRMKGIVSNRRGDSGACDEPGHPEGQAAIPHIKRSDYRVIQADTKPTGTARSTIWKIIIRYRTILILILLMAVFSFLKPVFLNPLNLLAILKNMSYVLIAGLGMTFIITLAGLDLSVGSIAAVVGVGFAMLVRGGFMSPIPALLIVMGGALFLGFLNGFVSVKGKIEPFLVTLATLNIYRGLALTLNAGKPVPIVIPYFADLFR